MKRSILKGKVILAVGGDPGMLAVLEEQIKEVAPGCFFDKAATYIEATERMASWTYDLVIVDGMEVRGFDILENAAARKYPVVMLTDHPVGSEVLRRSSELGARAYLPKTKVAEIVPFLEGVLRSERIRMPRLHYFN